MDCFCFTYERTFDIIKEEEGTSVRICLIKSMRYNQPMDMMYMTNDGVVSQRRIKVLQMRGSCCIAYCYLRKSKRTFKIENMLALVPVVEKEGWAM